MFVDGDDGTLRRGLSDSLGGCLQNEVVIVRFVSIFNASCFPIVFECSMCFVLRRLFPTINEFDIVSLLSRNGAGDSIEGLFLEIGVISVASA